MGLTVNTNMDAIYVQNNIITTNNAITQSLQRLSSGLRISSAKDNPSGFAVANSFNAKVSAMRVASQNASEGQSMLQVADGAYSRINDILVQMKALATQAASGQTESLATMNNEFGALQNEIDQIANSTQYGGTYLIQNAGPPDFSGQIAQYATDVSQLQAIAANPSDPDNSDATTLLTYMAAPPSNMTLSTGNASTDVSCLSSFANGGFYSARLTNIVRDMVAQANFVVNGSASASAAGGITFQVGATNASTDQLVISLNSATSNSLGVASTAVGIASLASAQAAMDAIDTALTSINSYMGSVGSYQNRLQYTIDNLSTDIQNYTASASTIADVDMASEMSSLSKSQILEQAGMAVLAQANSQPQSILKLLQG